MYTLSSLQLNAVLFTVSVYIWCPYDLIPFCCTLYGSLENKQFLYLSMSRSFLTTQPFMPLHFRCFLSSLSTEYE